MSKPVKIPLRKTCSLARFGYALDTSTTKRRQSLRQAVQAYGSRYVIQKLTVLRTYRKARNTPAKRKAYDVLDTDISYVQRYRNAMNTETRSKNLETSRAYATKKKKSYC